MMVDKDLITLRESKKILQVICLRQKKETTIETIIITLPLH